MRECEELLEIAIYFKETTDYFATYLIDPVQTVTEFIGTLNLSDQLAHEYQDWQVLSECFSHHPTVVIPRLQTASQTDDSLALLHPKPSKIQQSNEIPVDHWQHFYHSYWALFFERGVYLSQWSTHTFAQTFSHQITVDLTARPRRLSRDWVQWLSRILLAIDEQNIEDICGEINQIASRVREESLNESANGLRHLILYGNTACLWQTLWSVLRLASLKGLRVPSAIGLCVQAHCQAEQWAQKVSGAAGCHDSLKMALHSSVHPSLQPDDILARLTSKAHQWLRLLENFPGEFNQLNQQLKHASASSARSAEELEQLRTSLTQQHHELKWALLACTSLLLAALLVAISVLLIIAF